MDVSDELQHFDGTGSELFRQLVLQWLRLFDEARFVDVLDELDADLFEPRHRLVFEVQGLAGIVRPTSSAAVWTQPFCSSLRLFHTLSLTQTTLLFASCSVNDMIGATS